MDTQKAQHTTLWSNPALNAKAGGISTEDVTEAECGAQSGVFAPGTTQSDPVYLGDGAFQFSAVQRGL